MAVEEIYLTEMSLKELSEGKIICDGGVVIHPPKTDELGIMRISDNVIAYLEAREAIHDYITVLVVNQKSVGTPEELSVRLTMLLKDSILTWRDPNE